MITYLVAGKRFVVQAGVSKVDDCYNAQQYVTEFQSVSMLLDFIIIHIQNSLVVLGTVHFLTLCGCNFLLEGAKWKG